MVSLSNLNLAMQIEKTKYTEPHKDVGIVTLPSDVLDILTVTRAWHRDVG